MRKDTKLSLLLHTASDQKLGGAWEEASHNQSQFSGPKVAFLLSFQKGG